MLKLSFMKRTYLKGLVLLSILWSCSTSYAQQSNLSPNQNASSSAIEECGFDAIHQEMLQTNPVYLQRTNEFNTFMETYTPDLTKVSSALYQIPVVVHVMETGNSLTDISDAQIRAAIKRLNEDYRNAFPNTSDVSDTVDLQIEFALAVRDPSGNCTNGIVRYDMTGNATYMASGVYRNSAGITDATLKSLSVWNQTQYYNIWLVSEIDNNNGGSGIQGYAYFAGAHGSSVDGAVILANNFKDPSSTTAAHELGHAENFLLDYQSICMK